MLISKIEKQVVKQLRVREPLASREIAARAELTTNQISRALANLVESGVAVKHPGSTRRGDRSARYTKAPKPKA